MDSHEGISALHFGWLDYSCFIMMLALSTLIGIYFGFWGKKEDSPEEYLHGGKTMSMLPVSVSLIASLLSGITMMGDPSEVYAYGTMYWISCFGSPIAAIANNYIYLPVFYELQLMSVYEYLELRFNRSVRVMASVLCTVGLLLYIPIVIYVPALALSQVSGLNLHYITPIICIICIFYTMLGGIKAVVWTDFLQGLTMVLACIAVIILGLVHVGGFSPVWERNRDGGRIRVFEFSLSPFQRMTIWSCIIGGSASWIPDMAVNQAAVQRFLSLPTYSKAQQALIFLGIGTFGIKCLSCFMGLLIYSTYYDCDPLKTEVISRTDQLLPYYVMDIAAIVPGLPGLFVAGIFSAALSTMSSSLNSLGATLFEDFVQPCLKIKVSDKTASHIIKCVVIAVGAVCVVMVFIVDELGGIVQLSKSTNGVASGATFGLFTFGMFYPRGNSKGALAGSIVSMLVMGWIVFGNQKALAVGNLEYPKLPTTTDGCGINTTLTEPLTSGVVKKEPFVLFQITFMYYTLIGFVLMFLVGMLVSHLTESPELEDMNPALFSPVVRKYAIKKIRKCETKMRRKSNGLLTVQANGKIESSLHTVNTE